MSRARFLARDNRFVVRARLDDDREIRCYLPNTARLTDVLVPGAPLVVEPNGDPGRRTRWTVTRVWDGTWVALAASQAADLVAGYLDSGGMLPGWPAVRAVRREVTHGAHRFDLDVDLDDGRTAVVEVKSLSRARGGVAPLSGTPSTRGVAHLDALGSLAAGGTPVAVAFVVQRGDVTALDVSAPADPDWVAAVRRARRAGVEIVVFRCAVDEHDVRLDTTVPVLDPDDRPAPGAPPHQ